MTTDGEGDPEVLALYREGVLAVADRSSLVEWDVAACGAWTAAEVVRHVASAARWYDQWLDRALTGNADPPFPSTELPRRNDEEIHARAAQDPDEAVVEFVDTAGRYADRLSRHWDTPYGYPFGTVTAGLHAAVAASEWHLHAWDLARAAGDDHRPSDPGALFRAAGRCVTTAQGGLAGAAQAGLVRLAAPVRPWEQMLRASGRRSGAAGRRALYRG